MKHKIIDFLFIGFVSWIWAVFWQTPFAYFIWGMSWEQYISWLLCGIPITFIFFGKYLRNWLNWCVKVKEKLLGE
uniref:Uncharacterized protein n=1 Tax=viral metagenome TaxID=1070528 RepID=A0A6M3X5B3_9ZZZZ